MTEEESQTERKQHVRTPRDQRDRGPFGGTRVTRGGWSRLPRTEGEEVTKTNISKCPGGRRVRERLALFRTASQLREQNQRQRAGMSEQRTSTENQVVIPERLQCARQRVKGFASTISLEPRNDPRK